MKVIMFLALFLLIGAFFIITEQNIRLNSLDNITLFFQTYSSWVTDILDNTKTVTGYVVGMKWLPEN